MRRRERKGGRKEEGEEGRMGEEGEGGGGNRERETSAVSMRISTQTGCPGCGSLPSRDLFSSLDTCLSSTMDRLNWEGRERERQIK